MAADSWLTGRVSAAGAAPVSLIPTGPCLAHAFFRSRRPRHLTVTWLDPDLAEALALADPYGTAAEQLQDGHEGDHRLQAILGLQDHLDQVEGARSQPTFEQLQLALDGPGPPHEDERP